MAIYGYLLVANDNIGSGEQIRLFGRREVIVRKTEGGSSLGNVFGKGI